MTSIPNPSNHQPSTRYLRELVESVDLAQDEVADGIGVDRRTFRRYLAGDSRVPYPVQFTVECLVANVVEQAREMSARQLASTPRRELQAVERKLAREVEQAPNASRLRQRVKATLAKVQRAAARRP